MTAADGERGKSRISAVGVVLMYGVKWVRRVWKERRDRDRRRKGSDDDDQTGDVVDIIFDDHETDHEAKKITTS